MFDGDTAEQHLTTEQHQGDDDAEQRPARRASHR